MRCALVTPVDVGRDAVAVLGLYPDGPAELDGSVQVTARLVAEHAGLLLAHLLRGPREPAETEMPVVHRAAGLIMAQWGCPEDEARAILTASAEALCVPLPELAKRMVAAADR